MSMYVRMRGVFRDTLCTIGGFFVVLIICWLLGLVGFEKLVFYDEDPILVIHEFDGYVITGNDGVHYVIERFLVERSVYETYFSPNEKVFLRNLKGDSYLIYVAYPRDWRDVVGFVPPVVIPLFVREVPVYFHPLAISLGSKKVIAPKG